MELKMIIGRESEQELLVNVYNSTEAQFVCVYGRRRIGKTFLVREFFTNKDCIFFHATGSQKTKSKKQIKKFTESISATFLEGVVIETPKNWEGALNLLHKQISKVTTKKVVVFFDELPYCTSFAYRLC
jgi:uncharacterized protein